MNLPALIVLNPHYKLRFFEKKMPEISDKAKRIFLAEVSRCNLLHSSHI